MISKTALVGAAMLGVASATSAVSPPFMTTALEVVGRASSSSEVLSLNLTNLLILLGLKVAIVVFGLMSGTASTGRSAADPAMDQVDLTGGMCFLLYTGGDSSKLDCVARSACESPVSAQKFLQASKLWYKLHKVLQVVPFNSKYVHIMDKVSEAQEHGQQGNDCSAYQW